MAKGRKTRIRLVINEIDPVPLMKDFNTFITYLVENKPYLTRRKQFFSPKDLHQINQLMSSPNKENTPRTNQELYPLLHLFYHLIFYGKLFEKVSVGSQEVKIQKTDRMEEYLALISTEKYFLYLFDFGDEWHFYVRLVEIKKEHPEFSEPEVIESKGEAPEQYSYWE